jgi:hypothetical protein
MIGKSPLKQLDGKMLSVENIGNETTMSLEDARFSVLRYFAAEIQNAYGPNVLCEILESHIGWYHNIMSLLRNWYLIQTAAVDPAAY